MMCGFRARLALVFFLALSISPSLLQAGPPEKREPTIEEQWAMCEENLARYYDPGNLGDLMGYLAYFPEHLPLASTLAEFRGWDRGRSNLTRNGEGADRFSARLKLGRWRLNFDRDLFFDSKILLGVHYLGRAQIDPDKERVHLYLSELLSQAKLSLGIPDSQIARFREPSTTQYGPVGSAFENRPYRTYFLEVEGYVSTMHPGPYSMPHPLFDRLVIQFAELLIASIKAGKDPLNSPAPLDLSQQDYLPLNDGGIYLRKLAVPGSESKEIHQRVEIEIGGGATGLSLGLDYRDWIFYDSIGELVPQKLSSALLRRGIVFKEIAHGLFHAVSLKPLDLNLLDIVREELSIILENKPWLPKAQEADSDDSQTVTE